MNIAGVEIEDTFAEAFRMLYSRLWITAASEHWLNAAVMAATGYGCSVIGCDAEAGLERQWTPAETPDGRPGATVMFFGFSDSALAKAVVNRIGQCVMTCPSTAVYNGLESQSHFGLGQQLRFFGDGFQKSKVIGSRRLWRIPVMDGEFLVDEIAGVAKGVAGGNFLIQTRDAQTGLAALERGLEAIAQTTGVITPFPGGGVRSGSKVGSRYPSLRASTADAYCPTLRGRTSSQLHPDAQCCYEIVIDGEDEPAVAQAMRVGIQAAVGPGVLRIGAGNYGGKLGKFQFSLREILGQS
jgi:formylmethanofuran--tetrahydromethanopterin N-formyltransferase